MNGKIVAQQHCIDKLQNQNPSLLTRGLECGNISDVMMNLAHVVDELKSAYLIRPAAEPEPAFVFSHVLVQEAAYHSLLVKGRRELHRLVAVAIEREYADQLDEYIPALAYHYSLGEDYPKATEYAQRAAEHAMRVYALREAIAYYGQALIALDRQPDASGDKICDVILGCVDAAFGFEPFPKLLEKLNRAEQLARQLRDKRRLAMVLLMTGRVHLASGHASYAEKPLVECFTLASEIGDDQLAVLPTFAMGMVATDVDPRNALTFFVRAADLAHRYGNIDIEANALSMQAVMEARLGERMACRQSVARALGIVGQGTSPMNDAEVYLGAAWASLDLDETPQALEYAKRSVDKSVSTDNMECACLSFAILGLSHLRMEQLSEAVHAFEEAVRRSKISGAEEAEILGETGLGIVRFLNGHLDAIQELEKTLAHARQIGKEYVAAMLAQTLGNIYFQRNQAERSIAHLTVAREYYRAQHMRLYLAHTLELMANVLESQGEDVRARQMRAEREELLQGAKL